MCWIPTRDGPMSRSAERDATHGAQAPQRSRLTARLDAAQWPGASAGGKANALHALLRRGFEVPAGFCILRESFDAAVARCVPQAKDLADLRARLQALPINEALWAEITAQIQAIDPGWPTQPDASGWAIRSSALDEDARHHSLAGQQKTVLGAVSPQEIMDAVRQVWASYFDERALLYRSQLGDASAPGAMAVVIQRMVTPLAAGIMFGADPLSGDPDQLVIDAARGLGDQAVDGRATDTYYLDKRSAYVHRVQVEESTDTAGNHPREPVLNRRQLEELAACARRLDALFDSPLDVEWAFVPRPGAEHAPDIRPVLILLQSRPITTNSTHISNKSADIAPEVAQTARNPDPQAPQIWTNVNVGEALPGVATPLTWSIIHGFSRRGFERAFGALGLDVPADYALVGAIHGRVYLNLSQFLSVASQIPLLDPQTLFELAGGSQLEPLDAFYEQRDPWEFLAHLPLSVLRMVGSQLTVPLVAPLWAQYFAHWRDEFFATDLSALNHLEFRDQLAIIERNFERTGLIMLASSSNFLMSFVVLRALLRRLGAGAGLQWERALLGGLDVESAQPGYDLLELGHMARRSTRVRDALAHPDSRDALAALTALRAHTDVREFLQAFEAFRRRHGHRAPREAELATPRWGEVPDFVLDTLRGYIDAPDLPHESALRAAQLQAQREARAQVDAMLPLGTKRVFNRVLSATRARARQREAMRTRVVESLDIYRHYFLECGRRLTLQDALRQPQDVFYLRMEDLRRWLDRPSSATDFGLRVLQARALHAALAALPDPADTVVQSGQRICSLQDYRRQRTGAPRQSDLVPTQTISGLAGGAGRVTGRARVLRDPGAAAQLQPGEILVVPWADIGWTPLFFTAAALVTALGGPLSHACIVAREYRLPTVVNARGACDTLQTGDLITVDGDRGLVYIHERATDSRESD